MSITPRPAARAVGLGERRQPAQRSQPGYLRAGTVHQGDTSTREGLQHIHAVDALAQWRIVGCCPTISESHGIPVLEALLHQFPFLIQGFHSDNGSEFLNDRVEKLLHKLLVGEVTKSRAHRTSDNALVEGKNGAVVRKHIGHAPTGAEHAGAFQRFYLAEFHLYWNHHRPRGLAAVEVDGKGKRRRRYRLEDYRTPYEKLLSLGPWERCLKPGVTAAFLERQADRMSDRVCTGDAATQEKTAGREPVAVAGGRPEPARPARDGSVVGGGEGSSMSCLARSTIGLSFPLTPRNPCACTL